MTFLKNMRVGPKIIGGYGIAGLAIVVLAVVSLINLNGLSEKFAFLVHHDTPVLTNAQLLSGLMVDMETGLRGYMITGQEEYLEPYESGRTAFDTVMAEEQELTSDNPAAVAKLKEIATMKSEWLTNHAEPAIALRVEVESGSEAQAAFDQISSRIVGKERFDAIRAILMGIESKFSAAGDLEGEFLMGSITLDLVNMETGQRGFLLSGQEASLQPFTDGQIVLTEDINSLSAYNYRSAGVTVDEIAAIQPAVTAWKTAAAEPEIEARREINKFPKGMSDVIALIDAGTGKQFMDAIRVELGAFYDSEIALNTQRADEVEAAASSAQAIGIGIAVVSIVVMAAIGYLLSQNIANGVNAVARALQKIATGDLTAQVKVASTDEIGQMSQYYGEMQGYLTEKASVADSIAEGDISVEVSAKSERDTLGNAFVQMVTSQRERAAVAEQIAAGDLTIDTGNVSEKDVLGKAFELMVDTLRERAKLAEQIAAGDLNVDTGNVSEKDVLGRAFAQMITSLRDGSAGVAEAIAAGDLSVNATSQSENDVLGNAFVTMVGTLKQKAALADAIADGDLNVEVTLESEDDVLGKAFARMVDNLKERAQLAEAIANGDLSAIEEPDSEKDVLGHAFYKMVNSLRDLVGRVSDTANNLAESSGQLANAAEQAGQATQGVAGSSQQVAKGAEEQAANVQQTTSGVGQLSLAIDQIAKGSQDQASAVEGASSIVNQVSRATADVAPNAQAAAEGAGQAKEAAETGTDMVLKTVDGMDKIKNAVGVASTRISELGETSAEIGKIVAVIDDIAAQTNLLALNAAIEAARAGEQGRGFAVVADEVRGLAERVTEATKEIASLIDSVQKGVTDSIKAAEEGTKEVGSGVELAKQAGKALENIRASVDAVSAQIEQISANSEQVSASSDEMVKNIEEISSVAQQNSAASQQMAANSNEVSGSIDNIATIARQNSAGVEEVSAAAEQMSAQVEEVVASSQSLSDMAQELQSAVSVFRLNGRMAEVA